jgi:prepilin-type processing-associated H-X9-DG protein
VEHLLTVPRFPISFADGHVALAVRADPDADLGRALRAMGLTTGVPTIVPVGAGSRPAQLARLGPLLEKVVVAVAESEQATVVGAGATGGLAEALGQARGRKKAGFPMVGVASDGAGVADLEPEHTHFVLVPVDHGAGLARWVSAVATAAAGGNRSVALVAAGGEPAWEAIAAHARAGRLVMAVARTGGVADQLAAACDGRTTDPRARALADSGQVFAVDPAKGASYVAEVLKGVLSRPNELTRGEAP